MKENRFVAFSLEELSLMLCMVELYSRKAKDIISDNGMALLDKIGNEISDAIDQKKSRN